MFKTIEWTNNQVVMIDQRKLPTEEIYLTYSTWQEVALAIKDMVIRGAPAIGVATAMGLALAAQQSKAQNFESFHKEFLEVCDTLFQTRPTAVNLSWALERMKAFVQKHSSLSIPELKELIRDEAIHIRHEDEELCRQIGKHGCELINNGDTVLTHCNAGALATAGFGTALGVIYATCEQGKKIKVFADETRPFLQGARLTAWELNKNKVDTTLITDNMAGWLMKKGLIQKVVVGADRIAANGDVANKIGTYTVAVMANRHQIPFYVAAPLSTIDLSTSHGDNIPIEERPYDEVTHIKGQAIAPEGISIRNPAFDVTPAELVTGIITEKGVARPDYNQSLKELFK